MNTITSNPKFSNFSFNVPIKIVKISIIVFVGVYLLGNFTPFYEGNDSFTLATIAMKIVNNEYVDTNELLEKTNRFEFMPGDWAKTIDGKSTFPLGPVGYHFFTSFFYSIGNNFALFYLGPAFGILFLILSERIATKLFDKYVGLLTLLFLATNHVFYRSANHLQVDIIFSAFFIVGCYFLVTFFQKYDPTKILLASAFFVFATFMRINGIIFFPIEIIIFAVYFLVYKKSNRNFKSLNNNNSAKTKYNLKLSSKKGLMTILFLITPWICFFVFWFGYNAFFFGDPLTNYAIEQRGIENTDAKASSLIFLESKHFENLKQYSKYLLPYQFPATEPRIFDQFNPVLGSFWLGIVSLIILFSSFLVSLKINRHKLTLIIFILLILGTLWFFSSVTSEDRASKGVLGRYVMPAFTIFYMTLGFLFVTAFKKSSSLINSKLWIGKIFQFSIIIILGIFFITAFYFIPPVELIKTNSFEIKNPIMYSLGHPPELEGLNEKSVIVAIKTDRVLEYDVIPFHLLPLERGGSEESIILLKEIIQNDYDVYIFKKPTTSMEKPLFNILVQDYGFVMKDFSTSFCKVTINENLEIDNIELSDTICLKN